MRTLLCWILAFTSTAASWHYRAPLLDAFVRFHEGTEAYESRKKLPLKLVGVVTPQQEPALAVIEDLNSGETSFYRAGQELPYRYRLTRINTDGVLLLNADGTELTLQLKMREEEKLRRDKGLRISRAAGQPVLLVESSSSKRTYLSTHKLKGRSIQGTPLEKVLEPVKVEDGDILLSINEQPLDDLQEASRAAGEALKDLPLTLTLFRKKHGQVFTYFLGGEAPLPNQSLARSSVGPATGPAVPAGPYTGKLLVLGMVAGHAPRSLDVDLQAPGGLETVRVQIRPCVDHDGDFRGLEISQVDSVEGAERIGIRVNDLITAVNGVQLTGFLQTLLTVRKAFKQPRAEVVLARDQQTFVRTLERRF